MASPCISAIFGRRKKKSPTPIAAFIDAEMFVKSYGNVFNGNPMWNDIPVSGGELYAWNEASTYIQNPPFFEGLSLDIQPLGEIHGARALGVFGDSITTDHISPAGNIAKDSPAGKYLIEHGVEPQDFNQYGTRRGNDRVMTRGTFANIRLKNLMLGGEEGGNTLYLRQGKGDPCTDRKACARTKMPIYDAAMKYKAEGTPLIVIAGKEYGTGSSRDWAAKGTSCCSASRPSSPNRSSASTAATWWAWACCRSSSRTGRTPNRSA